MRILVSSEWSQVNTGYGTMTHEICRRLHAAGVPVAELASYATEGDVRLSSSPWPIYPVVPHEANREARGAYEANPENQFGRLAFHPAVIHWRPNLVVEYRDPWYQAHIANSPLRPFFRYLYIPTVDAVGQKDEWLDWMSRADAVASYTEWGTGVLRQESGGSLPLVGALPPGVCFETFRPVPGRDGLREAFGLPRTALVCGFVSRNQVRKRFPEMARAFRLFLESGPAHLTERAVLYWHTSWPDLGWDLPSIIRDSGIASRLWLTYLCHACGAVFSSRWMGAGGPCRRCGQRAAVMPNTNMGLDRSQQHLVYNLFDVYCQYASSEGAGLGLLEAAACGVPVMGVNYSGMGDIVGKLGGLLIDVAAQYCEIETGCWRASPSADSFCRQLTAALDVPGPVRAAIGARTRELAVRHYHWDGFVRKMLAILAGMPPALPWNAPPRYHTPSTAIPRGLSPNDFVRWGFTHVAGRPELAGSVAAHRMAKDLEWGATLLGNSPYFSDESFLGRSRKVVEVKPEQFMEIWRGLAEEKNHWEKVRHEFAVSN